MPNYLSGPDVNSAVKTPSFCLVGLQRHLYFSLPKLAMGIMKTGLEPSIDPTNAPLTAWLREDSRSGLLRSYFPLLFRIDRVERDVVGGVMNSQNSLDCSTPQVYATMEIFGTTSGATE